MVAVNSTHRDVLIVGGGVIGLSIARELHKRGAGRITLVDRGRIGCEASWAAAGMLAPNAECHSDDELFRLCVASNKLYPKFADDLLHETGIDIELDRSGTLTLAFSDEEAAELKEKYEWQRNAGIVVEPLTAEEVLKLESAISAEVLGGYLYPNDWQVENRKLVAALRKYCDLNGIELVENTEICGLGDISKLGFAADRTVVTAGAWTSQLLPSPEVQPIRGQMISLANGRSRILKHVIYSARGYLVPRVDGRILVGATVEDAGFCKEVTSEAVASLRSAALEICPALVNFEIKEAWAGLRPFADDGTPVIGRVLDMRNVFVATGHYRNGILLAPVTAKMIAEEILGSQDSDIGVPVFSGLG